MSQNRISLIVTFVEPYLSFVSSIRFVLCPTDMIRRPSGVTVTPLRMGIATLQLPDVPCVFSIRRTSWPSLRRQIQIVALCRAGRGEPDDREDVPPGQVCPRLPEDGQPRLQRPALHGQRRREQEGVWHRPLVKP